MPLLDHWQLDLNVDNVLRSQGADPAILRARSPRLVEFARRALEEGLPRLRPRLLYRTYGVQGLRHHDILLEGGASLRGEALARHLGPAQKIVVALCTIGPDLETYTAQVMATELVYGLALYGAGSAAVEALANAACQHFERLAHDEDWQTTIPLSPGMIGWPVEEGQPQIFSLLDGSEIDVRLAEGQIMVPMKSLSMIVGMGPDLERQGAACDICTMRETCRYQSRYDPAS